MSLSTDAQIRVIVNKMQKMEHIYDRRTRNAITKKAAKPMIQRAKANIKNSKKPHKRYNKAGEHVATYYPGNLKKSIRAINLRRSADTFVGPRVSKSGSEGDFKGNRSDGYYGHFVEFGTNKITGQHYMRRAADATSKQVLEILEKLSRAEFLRYVAKHTT